MGYQTVAHGPAPLCIYRAYTLVRTLRGREALSGIAAHRERQDRCVWCTCIKNIGDNIKWHVLSSKGHFCCPEFGNEIFRPLLAGEGLGEQMGLDLGCEK